MKQLKRGILISVEGIDGSGKSTLVGNLANYFQQQGYPVLATREPGATPLGTVIRGIVQKKDVVRTPQAEYLLFAADRAQHFHELVLPALADRMLVISDRMTDSSLVYQGYARGLDAATITRINEWTMASQPIDRTLYVKLDAATALQRLKARAQELTVFEEKISFTHKLIEGFDRLFADNQRIITLDGTLDQQSLCTHAAESLTRWIRANNLLV